MNPKLSRLSGLKTEWLLLPGLITRLILWGGYSLSAFEKRRILQQKERILESIAILQTKQIEEWYQNEITDGQLFASDEQLQLMIERFERNKSLTNGRMLSEILHQIKYVHSYENIIVTSLLRYPTISSSRQVHTAEIDGETHIEEAQKCEGLKFLIVEDDKTSGVLIEIVIKNYSREILKAVNGYEAIEICKKNMDIDVILMNIKMPRVDGFTATREIRLFNKKVLIIAYTAYAFPEDKQKAIEAGCDYLLVKPLNINELKMMVETIQRAGQ